MATSDAFTILALVLGTIWVAVNLYTYSPLYRLLVARALGREGGPKIYDHESELDTSILPAIDILLPAYDEAETIGHSIQALRETDYPQERLTINVIVEPDDRATRDELARLRRTHDFTQLVIPPSFPGDRNKPRALDYGFANTSGDIVGVIDAEDIVEPHLFGQVVAALVEGGHDYAQGKLDMRNEDDGILNTIFRGEYGLWYRFIVESFFRVGYPVPLGGTTNFFHRSVLEDVAVERTERFGSPWTADQQVTLDEGGYTIHAPWDPTNVTEDFELGLLLWESGFDMALLTAITHEESPLGLNAWIRQRTRWQKGKLYTLTSRTLVPPAGLTQKLHVLFQSATPHLGPINLVGVIILLMYANVVGLAASPVVGVVLLLGVAFIVQQLVIQGVAYAALTDTTGFAKVRRTVYNVVGLPAYWFLLWGSDVRAFVQLAFDHLQWEKTVHMGRHVLSSDVDTFESALARDGMVVAITNSGDGWTWELLEDGIALIRGVAVHPTEDGARESFDGFLEVLPVATDRTATFYVSEEEAGWTWIFEGQSAPVVAPAHFIDEALTREKVGQTKVAAGIAVVEKRPIETPVVSVSDDDLFTPATQVE